jgi:hypothetical protein
MHTYLYPTILHIVPVSYFFDHLFKSVTEDSNIILARCRDKSDLLCCFFQSLAGVMDYMMHIIYPMN